MSMRHYIFHQLNNHYWIPLFSTAQAPFRMPKEISALGNGSGVLQGALLSIVEDLVGETFSTTTSYSKGDDFFGAYSNKKETPILRYIKNRVFAEYTTAFHRAISESATNTFRKDLSESLLNIFTSEFRLENAAQSLMKYLFCDNFSIWTFNHKTNHFTMRSCSFEAERNFIDANASNCTLKQLLEAEKSWIQGPLNPNTLNSVALQGMQSMNRVRVEITSEASQRPFIAIFTFYSQYPEFYFTEKQKTFVEEFCKTSLSADVAHYLTTYVGLFSSLRDEYQLGKFDVFMEHLCKEITLKCSFEAASIFLVDDPENPKQLRLQAVAEETGESRSAHVYNLANRTKTGDVFKSHKIGFSYDLPNDPENSHTFDEKTAHSPANWIGLPVPMTGWKNLGGVLRATNKTRQGRVVPFDEIDTIMLSHFAGLIGYVSRIELLVAKMKRDTDSQVAKEQANNESLTDFIKTFRHELRSPLIVFTQTKSRLNKALRGDGLVDMRTNIGDLKKIREYCEDVQAIGDRLSFVTDCLTLAPKEIVKEFTRCDCFKSIVAPVLKFSELYARKRRIGLIYNIQTFHLTVLCDPMAASMAFHILVDNAIKYSDEGQTVEIVGIPRAGACTIQVKSIGVGINENERNEIFKKYVRGAEADAQNIDGAGIGLFLASEITKVNNGTLRLTSLSDPTTFELKIFTERNDEIAVD